jgi:hypothetical protein
MVVILLHAHAVVAAGKLFELDSTVVRLPGSSGDGKLALDGETNLLAGNGLAGSAFSDSWVACRVEPRTH